MYPDSGTRGIIFSNSITIRSGDIFVSNAERGSNDRARPPDKSVSFILMLSRQQSRVGDGMKVLKAGKSHPVAFQGLSLWLLDSQFGIGNKLRSLGEKTGSRRSMSKFAVLRGAFFSCRLWNVTWERREGNTVP